MPPQHDAAEFEPGQYVRHAARPDWGLGQVQSVIGNRVTVNFENAGKLLLDVAAIPLRIVTDPSAPDPSAPGPGA